MMPVMLGTIEGAAAAGFGATAALLLIGGGLFLRGQRDRLHYRLAAAAMDKGQPLPPGATEPAWLASLRRAVLTLTTGVGLLLAGAGVMAVAARVPMPPAGVRAPPEPVTAAIASLPVGPDGRPRPTPPPPPDPALERWHFAEDESAVGLAAAASGLVLLLLGTARVAFANVERRHERATSTVEKTIT